MAIISDVVPQGLVLLSDPLKFKFTMTGLINVNTYSRFGYQLLDSSDNEITVEEAFTPIEGVSFPLVFKKDVYDRVYTAKPQTAIISRAEPEMFLDVKLNYWEQQFDTTTCESSKAGEQTLSTYRILNSTYQYWGSIESVSNKYIPLTYCPPDILMGRNNVTSYYFYAKEEITVTIETRTKAGVQQGFTDITFPIGAHSILIDPSLVPGFDSDTDRINLTIPSTITPPTEQLVRVRLTECNLEETIWFQSFAGGYQAMHFDCIDRRRVKRKSTEVCRYIEPSVYPNDIEIQEGGLSIIDVEASEEITLVKFLKKDDLDNIRWYESFLNSKSYLWDFEEYARNIVDPRNLVKVLPKGGTLTIFEDDDLVELSFTFIVNQKYNTPNV